MNRLTKVAGLSLVALLALAAPTLAQVDIAGDWTLSVEESDGILTVRLNIEQDGEEFAGAISAEDVGATFSGGKISGNAISFLFEYEDGGEYVGVEIRAEVDGDEMAGEVHVVGFGSMPFTATRGG